MFEEKKAFILGMGRSGVSVAKLLCKKNEVLITDLKKSDAEDELKKIGVHVHITDKQEDLLDDSFDIVIKNPGVRLDNPVVIKANQLKIPVITELEVAYRYLPKVKIIGITGSNGKTTTTSIIYEMIKKEGLPVHLAGNIGIPLCDKINEIKDGDILVVEVSSHQLVNLDKFKVDVAILTNLSEVHLDHFGTYEKYKLNKMRIFNHQTEKDLAIINGADKEVCELTENLKSRKKVFSSKGKADIYLSDGYIITDKKTYDTSKFKLKGIHNYENIMAAILACKEVSVSDETIERVLSEFGGVEHRMEFVKNVNGRNFYNDSKATNVTSTITALKSFDKTVILIMGGLDRGHSFDELAPHLKNTKLIVCYGETKGRIQKFAAKNNIPVIVTEDIRKATHEAYDNSNKGDTILLSPACASWDQFDNFEIRGNIFKEEVKKL